MSIIDITVVADPNAIVRDHTISSNATVIPLNNAGKGYVFSVTYWNDVNHGTYWGPGYNDGQDENEGGFGLDIKAEIKDTIHWRMASLTGGFEYQCFLQAIVPVGGTAVMASGGTKSEVVSCAVQDAQGNVIAKQINDYYWESTITAKGTEAYHVQFSIFDSNGSRVGIFSVDPYVQVPGVSMYSLS